MENEDNDMGRGPSNNGYHNMQNNHQNMQNQMQNQNQNQNQNSSQNLNQNLSQNLSQNQNQGQNNYNMAGQNQNQGQNQLMQCALPGCTTDGLYMCACQTVRYCGEEHQRYVRSIFSTIKSRTIFFYVRFILRKLTYQIFYCVNTSILNIY
jgi:ATP-dependent 26S proteasome regulatory subunit